MRELSVAEQRYQAVRAVIGEGATVTEVAARFGVSRQTVHAWLAKYEAGGLEGLADGSHRPVGCPHQMPAEVEVEIARLRFAHPTWGPRRLVFELERLGVDPVPGRTSVYRALLRLNLIDPAARRPRDRKWKRWERGEPMELWQMDVVGGFVLADGTRAKVLSGVDDHSRFCVSAYLMTRESSQKVCDGLAQALRAHGIPQAILTDNGKVFTGRFNQPPVEVLFDRICRDNGIEHLLTQPRSPTTTGKIERFHRAIRTEFRTDRAFASLAAAQAELDEWVADYNTNRPHQALDMATPAQRFWRTTPAPVTELRTPITTGRARTPPAATEPGSADAPQRSVWSWCPGNRSASASPQPDATSTSGSPTTCCSSTTATNSYAPRNAPAKEPCESNDQQPRNGPDNIQNECQRSAGPDPSRINRSRSTPRTPIWCWFGCRVRPRVQWKDSPDVR